ncbi:SGNH/GDSL hydrolase family protein [Desulfatitalea alkaliphila]|uniref:SGNH/GDSL hydrolase family protein n=1 Tax=Desulfatitalea alkaliphila TaxID=2929485 RepID=A0AA41R244_9BACT|nr:SGNH/GDSL hydrolase family protein [Desulfatitalea alkaliphila]MCJ8501542.1 SGNH/GDSL hydrolase family protein [Desulfatitalea alkaliphila]
MKPDKRFAFALLMMPLLLAQALRVRRVTPKLPEPPGDRAGIFGCGPALRLLIVGDSAAAGVGAASQAEAFSGRIVARLGRHFKVHWKLEAQSGLAVQDVVALLDAASPVKADVIVVSAGVNDVIRGTTIKQWIARNRQLVAIAAGKCHCRHVLLSAVPPMHLFPALPQPLRWFLGERAKRLNQALQLHAAECNRCRVVFPDFPPDPALMAADGFHPGPLAYAQWAGHHAAIIKGILG